MYMLYARAGWGSVLVETQLAFYGFDYRLAEVGDLFTDAGAQKALAPANPITQIPTLILPDGTVMTESAAITLLLADATGRDVLVPGPKAPERARFLRWLVFIVANIYPTFTYADDPARFVADEAARPGFRTAVDDYAKRLWRIMEAEAVGPWFLGERFSALDIFVATMTHWRPNRPWFVAETPKLMAIAARTEAVPEMAAVWRRNFPPK